MKKVAAGIIVGLLIGLVIGYQFAPRTDTGELEETIDLLVEEVDASDELLQASEGRVDALEGELDAINDLLQASKGQVEELEAELIEALDDLDGFDSLINMTGRGLPSIGWNATFDPPQTVVYQLQNYDLDALEAAGADLYIIDYSWEGDDESRFTSGEVARLQNSSKVLSYISIGEAEDYLWYWQDGWAEGSGPRTPSGRATTRSGTGTRIGRKSSSNTLTA
jgi:hypothetical protein